MKPRSVLAQIIGDETEPAPTGSVAADGPAAENLSEHELVLEAFDADSRPGVMIDVGAHFGSSSTPFLERGWRVIGFEPDRTKHARLAQLAERHPGFTLHACAVADEPGERAAFYRSEESTGISTLVPFRETHAESDRVDVRTLSDVLPRESIERVDYLKIDAEGYDDRVLRGYPFQALPPRLVMAEYDGSRETITGYSGDDLARLLQSRGYSVFVSEWHPIVRYGVTHRWRSIRPYPCKPVDPRGWGNVIAVVPGDLEHRLREAMRPWL